jgi:hypothetical protein
MLYLNLNAPIVPNKSMGGFDLQQHISHYVQDIKAFSNRDKDTLQDMSSVLIGQFAINYTFENQIILRFDIITGKLSLISALKGYKGKLFGNIGIGSTISEALKIESRLYYDEIDEGYYIEGVDGIGIFLDNSYADHNMMPDNKIIEISIFVKEMLIVP